MKKIMKKILCSLLVVVMCLTAAPLQGFIGFDWGWIDFGLKASARIVSSKGMCGDRVFYTYDDISKELVISGIGDMGDYDEYGSLFYESDIKSVVIEEGVTSIGDYAFKSCSELESVSIPKSVTSIGRYSFYRCRKLENIIIPDGVTIIKEHAFDYCSSLENISMSKSITSIGAYAFEECYELRSITIPETVVSIGECAFNHCQYLKNIIIYDNVNSIGANAFSGTAYYKDINNWVDDVLYLGKYLIKSDSAISNTCKIKEGTLIIADKAFENCSSINEVIIPTSVIKVGAYAFYKSINLTSVILSEGLKIIGDSAFSGCSSLEMFSIPSTVIDIGIDILKDTAWFNYKGKGILSLDDWILGYKGTDENVSVILNANTKGVANGVFRSNENIVAFEVDEVNRWFSSEDGVLFSKDKDILIEYPCGKEEIYYDVPNTVLEIKEYAFYDCNYLRSLNISDSVKYIGNNAFCNCNNLRNIDIGIGLKAIGNRAFFYNGKSSKSIYIKDLEAWCNIDFESETSNPLYYANPSNDNLNSSYLYINEYAVGSNIVIPNTIMEIKQYAFYNCRNLKSIIFPNSIQLISNSAFYNCRQLSNIKFGSGVKNIGHKAFYNCVSLENIDFPDNVETIGYQAFAYCKKLNTITLGKCLKAIGYWGFAVCSELKEVYYPCSQNDWNAVSVEVGNFDGADIFLMHKHNYTVTITKKPTCTETGIALYTCSLGDTKTEILPANGHVYESKIIQPATHLTDGIEVLTCDCGNSYTKSIEKLEHDYKSVTTEPTCTNQGYTTYTCECGDMYISDYIDASHIWSDWTNNEYNQKIRICLICNKKEIIGEIKVGEIKNLTANVICNAVYLDWDDVPGNTIIYDVFCKFPGSDSYILFQEGDMSESESYFSIPGVFWYKVMAFAIIDGEFYDGEFSEEICVEVKEHSYTSKIITPATHLTQGKEKFTCYCGDTYTKIIPKVEEHTYIQVVTEPTCTSKGYTTYICECGDNYLDDYVDAKGHSYLSEITIPATHLNIGMETFTCACGDIYTAPIKKLEKHTYVQVVTEPTCTLKGYTTYICECGDNYISDYINVTAHNYISTTIAPTCSQNGLVTTFCTNCGNTKIETISAIGHNFNGSKCSNCGYDKAETCSCNCHKSGLMGIIWKIINIFNKLLRKNQLCNCGVTHY